MASRALPTSLRAALRPRPRFQPQTHLRQASSFLQERPSPPRLPAEQQAEFERLQRAAEAQLHSHTQIDSSTPSPGSPLATSRHVTTPSSSSPEAVAAAEGQTQTTKTEISGQPDSLVSLSGGIRKGAPPEFEGDKNPKTGEIGGPKNEPLRWGAGGDWSFNGRVTDF